MPPRPGQSGRHAIAAAGHCPDLCDRMEDGAVGRGLAACWGLFYLFGLADGKVGDLLYTLYPQPPRLLGALCWKVLRKGQFS